MNRAKNTGQAHFTIYKHWGASRFYYVELFSTIIKVKAVYNKRQPVNAYQMGNATKSAGGSLRFAYGANQRRYKQIKTSNGETTTTIYVDKLFERTIRSQGTVDRFYVGDIAVIIKEAGNSKVRYLHRDRLGSMIGSFDEQGILLQHHSFDPFGKPRDGQLRDNFTDVLTGITIPQNILGSETSNRGFTDHEHLDDAQLIHMNGRVYDYNLGRFLSVDPFIQAPGNSQSMNPYSYIMNNPLAGTDPSGYAAECKSDDYACQWDQSMASVLGVPREVITEMYNGIKRKKNAVKNHVAKVKNVSPEDIDVELEYDEETDTEDAIVTISGGMKRTNQSGLQTTFNDEQLGKISGLFKDKDYAGAYDYITSQIDGLDSVDGDTKYWFEQAAGINRNDDTPANIFIRAFTKYGLAVDGIVATDEMLQGISDTIGRNVVGDVLRQGGIPKFNNLVTADIRVALGKGGQTIGGWGGSFYFWNLPFGSKGQTVGQLIQSDPHELGKFRRSLNHASKVTMITHPVGGVGSMGRTLFKSDTWQAGWNYFFDPD